MRQQIPLLLDSLDLNSHSHLCFLFSHLSLPNLTMCLALIIVSPHWIIRILNLVAISIQREEKLNPFTSEIPFFHFRSKELCPYIEMILQLPLKTEPLFWSGTLGSHYTTKKFHGSYIFLSHWQPAQSNYLISTFVSHSSSIFSSC